MDPTVTGALVAGGAALIGFGASAWSTQSTVRASREAALDQRLWEKRSELYEELLRTTRDVTDKAGKYDPEPRSMASITEDTEIAQGTLQALRDMEDKVRLYASADVRDTVSDLTDELHFGIRQTGGHARHELISAILDFHSALRKEIQGAHSGDEQALARTLGSRRRARRWTLDLARQRHRRHRT